MARELFVYWKVEREQAPAAHRAAIGLLQALRQAHPELEARLMQRADEPGERSEKSGNKATFMETYSALPAGVTLALQAAIEAQARLAFEACFDSGPPARHVEVFERLDG